MNDNRELTDEQLLRATTRPLPSGTPLDSDTAAAREAFLSLGAAVEADAADFDERLLAEKLTESCVRSTQAGSGVPASRKTRDWWSIVLGGALAAASLIAIVRIAVISQQLTDEITVATKENSPKSNPPIVPAFASAGWSDPLDEEIALAAVTIEQLGSRSRGVDGSLLEMNDRLDALNQELSVESL
jgi:hypothetical protein